MYGKSLNYDKLQAGPEEIALIGKDKANECPISDHTAKPLNQSFSNESSKWKLKCDFRYEISFETVDRIRLRLQVLLPLMIPAAM